MNALGFEITCRACGGECVVIAPSSLRGATSAAVVGCLACRSEWHVKVVMDAVVVRGRKVA